MKKRLLPLLFAALAPVMNAAPIEAWDDIYVTGRFSYTSEHVFRGFKQSNAAFQFFGEVSYPVYQGNIYTGLFYNQPLADADKSSEFDFHLGYVFPLTKELLIDFGQLYYWYPQGNTGAPAQRGAGYLRGTSRSTETFLGFCYDTSPVLVGINLNPALYYYYDWNVDKHTVEGSLAYVWDLSGLAGLKGLSLTPRGFFGYQSASRPYGDTGALQDFFRRSESLYYGASLTLDWRLNDYTGFYLACFYTGNYDTGGNPYRHENNFVGASVGVKFDL